MSKLSPEKALLFRITHVKNIAWMMANGLHCKNSEERDPDFVPIGNADLIAKRSSREIPIDPGGRLSDYIPFYFTPFSPMMYNIKTGYGGINQYSNSQIAICVCSFHDLVAAGAKVIFTDRHAYLRTAQFFDSADDLDKLDWEIWRAKDFKRDDEDPGKLDRYQAEALVYRHLPIKHVKGIVCYSENEKRTLERFTEGAGLPIKVVVKPEWYFR